MKGGQNGRVTAPQFPEFTPSACLETVSKRKSQKGENPVSVSARVGSELELRFLLSRCPAVPIREGRKTWSSHATNTHSDPAHTAQHSSGSHKGASDTCRMWSFLTEIWKAAPTSVCPPVGWVRCHQCYLLGKKTWSGCPKGSHGKGLCQGWTGATAGARTSLCVLQASRDLPPTPRDLWDPTPQLGGCPRGLHH